MAIIKRAEKPATADAAADKVAARAAAAAPDGGKKMTKRGNRLMFNVGLDESLMARLDEYREQRGLSRPACVRLALLRLLDDGGL